MLFVVLLMAALGLLPRYGLLALWRRQRADRRRALGEDALKHLHACEWRGQAATLESLAGALRLAPGAALRLVDRLAAQGLLRIAGDGLRLTPDGEQVALAVVRAHRLWERYLADEARMPLSKIHAEAERREHAHTAGELQVMDAAMGFPARDPHGDPIPTAEGRLEHVASQPLTEWPLNVPARIVHLEDEPAAVFDQIAADGLRPGQVVRVLEATAERLTVSDGLRTFALAPIVAANISVATQPAVELQPARRLTSLRRGERAVVQAIDDALQGFTRRRLLDLGLTPGASITAELPSLLGDPTAYRVRGALIALRRDQAEHVLVES